MHVFSRPSFAAPASAPEPAARFVAGTPIDTPDGPRPVETLRAGDRVTTREGPRAVAAVGQRSVAREDWTYRRSVWPVRVPVGSLGNAAPLRLPPGQRVLLHGPAFAEAMGVAEAWVPVEALVGLRGLALERPLGTLRQHGLALAAGDGPGAVRLAGAWCDLGPDAAEAPDRARLRAAFQAMNEAGEPPIV